MFFFLFYLGGGGGGGGKLNYFRDLGCKGKLLLGSRGNYFQGFGEINALFLGIMGAQTPTLGVSFKVHLLLKWLNQ